MTSKSGKSRVFILGAGCSRAPAFGANRPTLPLIRDFISISTSLPLKNDYAPLWEFLEEVHGFTLVDLQAGSPNIEQVLSLAEASAGMIWSGSRHDYFDLFGRYFFLGSPAGYLKTLILETLNTLSAPLAITTCSHHDALVDSMGVGDVVITFNYDLIIDSSLRRSGQWSEYDGYGVLFPVGATARCEGELASRTEIRFPELESRYKLLKLHGSLNWLRRSDDGRGRGLGLGSEIAVVPLDQAFEIPTPDPRGALFEESWPTMEDYHRMNVLNDIHPANERDLPVIIPPNIFKTTRQFAGVFFSALWRNAFAALSKAQEVFLIGHSLGAGDLHFTTMLREAFWRQHRRVRLNIVNPAPEAVLQRIQEEHLTTFAEPIVVGSTLADLASSL